MTIMTSLAAVILCFVLFLAFHEEARGGGAFAFLLLATAWAVAFLAAPNAANATGYGVLFALCIPTRWRTERLAVVALIAPLLPAILAVFILRGFTSKHHSATYFIQWMEYVVKGLDGHGPSTPGILLYSRVLRTAWVGMTQINCVDHNHSTGEVKRYKQWGPATIQPELHLL